RRAMTVRAFYNYFTEVMNATETERAVGAIAQLKPFQGDDYFDLTGFGESVFFPYNDNLLAAKADPKPDGMALWRRIVQALADRGIHLNVHAQLRASIEAFLDEIEAINKVKPIKGLRWTFSHLDQVEPHDIERMKRLGVYAQIHSRPVIQGALMLKIHGE